MAGTERPFRTERSIQVEAVTRSRVLNLLEQRGFEDIHETRVVRGTAITQTISAISPTGDAVQMRVRLCWRRDGRNPREARYSAAQLKARLVDGDWDKTLASIAERDHRDGNSHVLLLQNDGDGFSHAALVPAPEIRKILDGQRKVSNQLLHQGLMGGIQKNHAENGASPTIWLQDDRVPAARAVADVLWDWPGVVDILKLPQNKRGRYHALGQFLRQVSGDEVVLTLQDLDSLVGPLPREARKPQFWANVRGVHESRRRQWMEAGFKAFYLPKQEAVRFVRLKSPLEPRAGSPWIKAELRDCVSIYRQMWRLQEDGKDINKTAWRKSAMEKFLPNREPGAFEFRMQNISAVLDDFDIPILRGYLPRRNIGPRQYPVLLQLVNEFWDRSGAEPATSDPRKLAARVRSARLKSGGKTAPPPGNSSPQAQSKTASSFKRLAGVIAWVLDQAKGCCEGCGEYAPFRDKEGLPFLEVHHIRPLAEGGPDKVDNAVALCPNCHRRLHHGSDGASYRSKILKRLKRLVDYPVRIPEKAT